MNTLGISNPIVVGDTDGLIAIIHAEDKNHIKAKETVLRLLQNDIQTLFPLTCIVETVTTLKRKLNSTTLAELVVDRITNGTITIEDVDIKLLSSALVIFDLKGSKQNTLFDAIVAATAKKHKSEFIFSFDKWYEKLGFRLAVDLQKQLQGTSTRKN
ncbi:MAG: type II toxin-antitoxin system VapC family toxin [Candidatus Levybacteria bacterium]|nr:type II toxin-antitoxin system VapC family toxin [Candidatus Levybacteria bacterium]